jgi:hypothetical protein
VRGRRDNLAGEYYAGPYFEGEEVISVRKSPAEVSFRKLCSGGNPAAADAVERDSL